MELRSKFLALSKVALAEFAANHPGNRTATKIYESMFDISEEEIVAAAEQHKGLLAPAIEEYICYVFTNGRNGYDQPTWLRNKPACFINK